jgi:hypothetical protein
MVQVEDFLEDALLKSMDISEGKGWPLSRIWGEDALQKYLEVAMQGPDWCT